MASHQQDATDQPPCCPACGLVLDLVVQQREIITGLERDLRARRSQVSRIQGERRKRREHEPRSGDAYEVFRYWKERVAPTAREFGDNRYDAVLARLNGGHSVAEIKRAVDGVARVPFVDEQAGRRKATGASQERRADLELICRDEGNLTRFQGYADEPEPKHEPIIPEDHLIRWARAIGHRQVLDRLRDLRGWDPEAIRRLGLGLDGRRVVFPVRDQQGILVGVQRYAPNPDQRSGPKMLAQGKRDLFPAPETVSGGTCWLVEGEPDAVAAHSVGLPAVAVPGLGKWDDGWAQRFEKFERIYVVFDCDKQGREAATKRARDLGTVTRVTIVELDPHRDTGYDVGDLVREMGQGAAKYLTDRVKAKTSTVVPFQQPTLRAADPYEEVLDRLEANDCRVKRGANESSARCPVHDDRAPSLSVGRGRDGAVLHCHAGCDTGQIVSALGMELRDLFRKTG